MSEDKVFGLDSENEATEEKVVDFEETRKKMPFAYWKIGEESRKMKLATAQICKLEEKYRTNVMNLVLANDTPPLGVMLTVIQAAMEPWNHGVSFKKVQGLYDAYLEDGGNQIKLFADVIMPIMQVSGFFTEKQAEAVEERLEDLQDDM